MEIKSQIKRVANNKDARTLTANFAWLSLLQVAGYVFPLITLPYLARVIGVDKFGEIAFAAAVIVYFQTVVDWGFSFTATRDVARNRDNKEVVSEIFSNVIWCKIMLTIASALILFIITITIPAMTNRAAIIWATFLLIPGHIMFPDWFFQGVEKMKYTSILNLCSKCLFTILIFIFVKNKADYIYQPLFTSFGFVLSGIIAMYIIIYKWGIKIKRPDWAQIKKTIKGSRDIFINQLAPNLYNSFSVLILGLFGGAAANGKLDGGAKFVNITNQFFNIISRTIFPYLSRKSDKHKLLTKITIYLSIVFTVILFFSAPLIVKIFYTPEFNDSIIIMQIMSFSIIFLSINNMYGTNFLIINGEERKIRNITIVVSAFGLLTAFPFIYYFSYIGAALNITLTRALLGFATMYYAKSSINRGYIHHKISNCEEE